MKDHAGYLDTDALDFEGFRALTARTLDPAQVPHAAEVAKNVPLYDMAALEGVDRRALMAEWARVFRELSGVIVLKRAYRDTAVIDRASAVFRDLIAAERASAKGDHFAAGGANDRVWNAAQKHCLADPEGWALYMGNPAIAAACEAWLGPHYQVTAQVNQVRPGGRAQSAHRDYHLGFMSAEQAARFPAHVHELTAALTLQGGIAHVDMAVESGPTKLLPFSQLHPAGYLAFHDPAFRDHFEASFIQVPLEKGDAIFFNPALFHAAGENRTEDVDRLVNLLQVSSAFGRAMEAVDRRAMSLALYPALRRLGLTEAEQAAAIAATAEGYAFPTNLDTDPPVGGLAPATMADHLRQALAEDWPVARLAETLDAAAARARA